MAPFTVRDLAERGLVLIPSGEPEFERRLEGIRAREVSRLPANFPGSQIPEGAALESTAILVNGGTRAILATALEWSFETETGDRFTHRFVIRHGSRLLLPGQIPPGHLAFYRYWHTVFPASSRLAAGGKLYGNNGDVRPPGPDEEWRGGVTSFAGKRPDGNRPVRSVTLELDGACLEDGEFLGPNRLGMFEYLSAEVETKVEAARIARTAQDRGLSIVACLTEVADFLREGLEEPAPPPGSSSHPGLDRALQQRRAMVSMLDSCLASGSTEGVLFQLLAWLESPRPRLRRG